MDSPHHLLLLQQQRADAKQFSVAADQRGAAPLRMRGRGEDGLVEDVFPVARELALGEHRCLERVLASALPDQENLVANGAVGRRTAGDRFDAQAAQRQHQPEPGDLVVGKRMARHHRAVVGGEPDGLRLGDQVTDGEDQAVVADHDAVADTLCAENAGGERFLRDFGLHQHHRVQRGGEIEAEFLGLGLEAGGEGPIFGGGHGPTSLHQRPAAAGATDFAGPTCCAGTARPPRTGRG